MVAILIIMIARNITIKDTDISRSGRIAEFAAGIVALGREGFDVVVVRLFNIAFGCYKNITAINTITLIGPVFTFQSI